MKSTAPTATARGEPGKVQSMVVTKRRYTYDEWLMSADNTPRAELIEGEPVERMSTTPDHAADAFAVAICHAGTAAARHSEHFGRCAAGTQPVAREQLAG